MKIAIRGGHNFQAMGAVGIISETHEDRKVKDSVIKYLRAKGHEVMDVTPSNMPSRNDLYYGVSRANSNNVDLFISIHFNKCYPSYAGAIGSECWTNTGNKTANNLANKICKGLGSLGFKNRGVKDGLTTQRLYEIRATKMSAIIVEVCFVEATNDVALYRKLGADIIGKRIADSIDGKTNVPISIDKTIGTVTGNSVRVRSTPDTKSNSNIIGHLNKGDTVTLYKDSGNGFYDIYYGTHGGYISKNYVKV